MFYYIEDKKQIVICEQSKEQLLTTLKFMPQYQDSKILKTEKEIINFEGKFYFKEDIQEELEQQEKERIAKLKLTKREVFLGLYQAKQITPDMIKAQITDPAVLIEFEYANDYYRGNPLIDVIGASLGITSEQLDKFFETNDYTYLIETAE